MGSVLLISAVYLAAMVVAVPISARLGLGSVLGYLMAGIVIGPVLHLAGSAGDVVDRRLVEAALVEQVERRLDQQRARGRRGAGHDGDGTCWYRVWLVRY